MWHKSILGENKKKNILVILILLMCSRESKKTIQQVITENKFSDGSGMHYLELKFNTDNTYIAWYSSEGLYWYNDGKYSIENDKINLIPTDCKSSKDGPEVECSKTLGKAKCGIEKVLSSFSHEFFLICKSLSNNKLLVNFPNEISDSLSLPLTSSTYKEGVKLTFQSIPVITMGKKSAKIIENAKLRDKPSIEGKILTFSVNIYDGPRYEYLLTNTPLIIWLRTSEKIKVNNWENYWYFIESGDSTGWVFGEFIKY